MSLKKYAEKRNFAKTPEPPPGRPVQAEGAELQFCVQRHHASHLHYDFRLEVGGALKSWAVPKGPTLDPNEKRLAMMVEDHPLQYGDFEGVIPEGYGAGSVMLWDRGTYELLGDATAGEQLARGDFKFRLFGKKLTGEFAIVRMKPTATRNKKGNEWLLLKKKDGSASPGWDPEDHSQSVITGRTQQEIADNVPPAKPKKSSKGKIKFPRGAKAAAMPKIVAPMLAALGKGSPGNNSNGEWLYEVKWDGVRAAAFVDDGKLRLVARSGNAIDKQYPELSVLPRHVDASEAILDGEIATLDRQGRPSFEILQQRMHVTEASAAARLSRAHPVIYFAFDLLYFDGHDLRGVPLIERKKLLKEVLQADDHIRYSDHFTGNGPGILEAVKQQGLEGIVAKRAQSLYESRRSSDWVKWKVEETGEFVICGFTEGERAPKGEASFGALILGLYEKGKLRWAGNVGTGFDGKTIRMLHGKLMELVTTHSPLPADRSLPKKVTWVKPVLVCSVKFSNWTEEGHLRAPVYIGLRNDIKPSEVKRLEENGAGKRESLLDASLNEVTIDVDSQRLKFTNLNKVFYPKDGYVKRDLLNYYDAVAPLLVPHLKGRPMSLKRYPNGIHKDYFFQKQVAESFPDWLHTEEADGKRWVIGDDRATLLYLVNLGCIDHNPWMSRVGSLENPDYVLIDLDPFECGFEKIVQAALWVRKVLERIGLKGYPKTTGGDGLHIFIPLEPRYTYEHARQFAQAIAALGAAEHPELFTTPRSVAHREKGKVYFDWQQIAEGKTISAPYVLRPYDGAPVATPLAWDEVTPSLRPEQFHLGNAMGRFDAVGDLFEQVLMNRQKLESAVEKLIR